MAASAIAICKQREGGPAVHVGMGSHGAAVSLIAADADKQRSTNWQSPRSSISRLRDRNITRRPRRRSAAGGLAANSISMTPASDDPDWTRRCDLSSEQRREAIYCAKGVLWIWALLPWPALAQRRAAARDQLFGPINRELNTKTFVQFSSCLRFRHPDVCWLKVAHLHLAAMR